MSTVVAEWRPRDACRLQQALRLTNEAFAAALGASPRTVAKWHANPTMRLTWEMQQALDTMLARAGDDVQARFDRRDAAMAATRHGGWRRRLDADRNVAAALDWLDGIRMGVPGTSRRHVETLLENRGADVVRERAHARAGVDRITAAKVVRDFYASGHGGMGTVTILDGRASQATTMLATEAWLGPQLDLRQDAGSAFTLSHGQPVPPLVPTPELIERAALRIAEILVARTKFVEAQVYRLLKLPDTTGAVEAEFAVDSFTSYALSWDLLDAEVADQALGLTSALTLRESLMPTLDAALHTDARICVGGAQALCAFARPGASGDRGDYLLLVQERSPRVVNATGRLAVIPKCFHQPITDVTAEVSIDRTILRELEEELFGRLDLEAGAAGESFADPMHPARLSEPMRWLTSSDAWDLQLTGFGINLTSGNYEFAAVMAVHDEGLWRLHGGAVEANWEAARLRTISSMDRDGLAVLLKEPGWSDEGLLAFSLGLKRLAELNPHRVALPPFEIGVET